MLRGPFLAEAARWMKERAEDLTPPERNYITASEESQQRIEREERTRQEAELQKARELADQKTKLAEERGLSAARQRRFRNALAVIALVVTSGAVGLYRLWRASEAARDEAERALGAVDLRDGTALDREGRPAEALLHLASALGRLRGDPLASTALMHALTLAPRHQLRHEGTVRAASFSADGTRVVTASDDKTARIWDIGVLPADATGVRKPTFPSFLRWLLDDPATRTISPYSTVTLPEFIRAQTRLCIPNALAEVERLYLGHPALREPSDCKPPNSKETNARALDR